MDQSATPINGQFLSSPRLRRFGAATLAAIVVVYLVAITYSLSDSLNSTKRIVIFAFLWFIGLVALVLLSRAWRRGNEPGAGHHGRST